MPSRLYLLSAAISWPMIGLPFRLRSRGTEKLPDGGFVLAANHNSNLDPWPLGLPLFPRRQLRFMAKSELFNPVVGPFLNGVGSFPVRRGAGDLEAIQTAIELVREGEIVVMFPEGTRRGKGRRKKHEARPHTGAARIALGAGAPLVPAAIKGTDRNARLGPWRVVYGDPVPIDDLRGQDLRRASREATDRLMAAIRGLEATF